MAYLQTDVTKVTTRVLQNMKLHGEKIAMLTAYDYSMASLLESAKIDVVLVGDSAANVMEGHKTTLPISLDEMIIYAASVVRAIKRALVVVDMPFGTYQGNSKQALASAIRIMKETGADAIKMEGGEEILESVQRILSAGIPIMGHLGLTPQSINKFGTYAVRATEEEEAEQVKKDALILQEAGCFALVLEKIPAKLAGEVSSSLKIPTIGIGAGPHTDGQVLVLQDMLGNACLDWEIVFEFRLKRARYVRIYADVLVITENKVFSLEFKMKDKIDFEEVSQAAKYVPYLEIVFGTDYEIIPALVLTAAKDFFDFVAIGKSDSVLPVCSGDMLFNVFDEYLEFLSDESNTNKAFRAKE